MSGDLSMFVTSVTSSGAHIKFYAQLHTEKYAALDSMISANQNQFDVSTLSSPYELKPGEQVLVKSMSGASAKWHRARVNNIQSIEYGTVAIQFIDYGTNEVVHFSQICTSRNPVAAAILAQPPLAVECVLAEVVPAMTMWADAAITYAESKLLFQVVRGQLVRQDGPEGPLHVRVFTADGSSLVSQLVALGLGRPAQTGAVPPGFQTGGSGGYGAAVPPPPAATPPQQQPEFAVRVKEMTTAPAQPGSEVLVTVCHYSSGPAKFAIQNHHQRATLSQLMADIQAYCRSSPPASLPLLEPGAVCLGASAARDGQFLRGVITQVDGGLVKVYWADFGHDETKAVGELRAMPRQFVGPWIQASRVSLAGLEGLAASASAAHVFREITEGKLLTCKIRGKDQPNQVDLFDGNQSILEQLLQRGAYTAPGAAAVPARGGAPYPGGAAPRYPSPATSPATSDPAGPPLSAGSTSEVIVVEVSAVNNLYVQLASSVTQLQQMLGQLSETLSVSGQPLPSSSLRVGALCAVMKDGGYQRAKVVSLGRRDIKVQYIDVGTSELVPIQSVLALEKRFAAMPPQAILCSLEGLEGTHGSADQVRFLQSVTGGGPLLCSVVQLQGERRVVRLTDPRRRPPLDLNATMREAVAASTGGPEHGQGQLIRGPPTVTVNKPPVELGKPEQLVVMHVESAGCWFGQLAKLDADAMAVMEEAMQNHYSTGKTPPLSSAPVGTYCAALSSVHEAVYRAKVIGRQGTQVTIQFIDYGDKEDTSVSNVFPLSTEFTQLPQLGISCSLPGAGAVPADIFQSTMLNRTVDVVLRSCRPGSEVYEVSLVPNSQTNRPVIERLTQAGLRDVPDGGAPPSHPAPARSPASSGGQLPQQQLPVGVYKEVEVVHVVSPAEFYVQLKEQFPAVDAIQEQLTPYGSLPPPASPPAAGQTVAALYPDDGAWYRGRVLEAGGGQVTVFFVDYGDTRAVTAAEVRPLRPEHAALAGQAICCCTSDAGRSGRTSWSEQETERFRSAVMEVPYLARCEEQRGRTALVTLAKAEMLEPVLGQPVAASAPPVTRQASGEYAKKPAPRADMDRNWRDRPAGPASPAAPTGDPFSGRMRMDQPESYSRPQQRGGGGPARDGWGDGGGGGGGGGDRDSRGSGERSWEGHDDRGSQERSWEGHDDRGSQERGWGGQDHRGSRGAPDGAGARGADSWSSGGGGGGGRPDRGSGGAGWSGSGRTRGQDAGGGGGDSWSSGGGGGGFGGGGGGGRPRGQDRNVSGDSWSSGGGGGGGRPPRGGGGDAGGDSWSSGGGGRPPRGGDARGDSWSSGGDGGRPPRGGGGDARGDSWSSGGGGGRPPRGGGGDTGGDSWSSGGGGGGRPIRGGGGSDMTGRPGPARQPPSPAVSIPDHSTRLTPSALQPGAELRASPTWICGLHEFFIQPLDGGEAFNKLMTEMQTFYGDLRRQDGAETSPAVGKPVAARFTDGAWYRAVVNKCSPAELMVYFVDYGNSATVEKQLVKRLKEEYCRLPCHAYRCQFGGVQPVGGKWKVLSEKELAKYFEAEIQVTCLSSEGNLSSVEVALTSSGQRATDQLVAGGLAERPAAARAVQQANIGPYPALERPFSAGERVEVFVACVISPSRLYVQLSENTAEIEQTAADIEKSTSDCKLPCPDVGPDEICLAPFEGVYYRGLITAVEGQQASVYFVDYGNTEQMDVSDLVECPMSLVDLPAQAIQCSVTGVAADCQEQLSARVDQMELTALVDRVLPASLIITLLDGGTNINLELGGDGQARSPEPATKKTTATATAAAAPAPAAAPAAAPTVSAPQPTAAPAAAVPAAAPFASVTVSFAVSPHEFYVQDATDGPAALLDSLMGQLETEYGQLGPEERAVTQVQPGDLVAAPFADDGVFYRARLLTADPAADDCQVQFIDYGNCQLTPRQALKRLTPALLAPARLAQQCRLPERPTAGQWSPEDTEAFEVLAGTLEKALTLQKVKEEEDVWTVRLLDGEVDVGQEMVKAGQALPPGEEAPAPAPAAEEAEAPPAAEAPVQPAGPVGMARLKEARLVDAAVVFALSPTDFWVQLSDDTSTLDDLMYRLEVAQLTRAAAPAADQLLVARYAEDGAMYRARVLSTTPDTITVLFVDYGNTETVPTTDTWVCPEDLAAVPPLAVRCSLPLEPQPWSDAAVDKFSSLVGVGGAEERSLNLELVKPGDPTLVNLFDGEQDVAFAMVGAGFGMVHVEERPVLVPAEAKPAEEPAPTPAQAEAKKTDCGETNCETTAPTEETAETQPAPAESAAAPAVPAGERAVFVAHVNSPLEFYVQSADTAPLDDLMEKLAAAFPTAAPVSAVEVGLLTAAPYSEDAAPYRARVLSVDDGQARVVFVDYGNSESVAVSELKELGAELSALPPQARPCQLAVEGCEESAAERLRELTEAEEEPMTVREVAAGAVARVRLTLTAGDAAELLTAAGLCRPRADPQLPAPPPPPAEPLRLLVSHIDSPASFFVQRLSELAALDELADQLAELYDATEPPPPPVLSAPCCGDLCVARSAEEEGWHRARVEAVSDEGEIRVRLVDFGSSAAATEVRAAAAAVCRTPAMALRCRLPARPADEAGWGQEAAAALAEFSAAADHKFDARLVADGGDALVALLSLQGRSVTQMLQDRGVEMVEEPLAAEGVAAVEEKPVETETGEQKVVKEMGGLTVTEDHGKQEVEGPAETKDQPAETKDQPAETKDQPSETKDQPSETKDQPDEAKDQPAEAEPRESSETGDEKSGKSKQDSEESEDEGDVDKSTKTEDTSDDKPNDSAGKTDQMPDEVNDSASDGGQSSAADETAATADRSSPLSEDAAPPAKAGTNDGSPAVDGDATGNGHKSPLNGQKDGGNASEAASSAGQKSGAAEEAPDAPGDSQAAA